MLELIEELVNYHFQEAVTFYAWTNIAVIENQSKFVNYLSNLVSFS